MIKQRIYMQLDFHPLNQSSLKQYKIAFSYHSQDLLHNLSKNTYQLVFIQNWDESKQKDRVSDQLNHLKQMTQSILSSTTMISHS